jgi:prepilin-type N-terminal cleavage/methylation domain-containing protein
VLRKRGFTFIEIAIVIAILGIIFALAFPNYRVSRRTNRLYAEARKLSMDIRFMRELSYAHQKDTKLEFSDAETYKIYRESEPIKSVSFESGIQKVDGPEEIAFNREGFLAEDIAFILTNYYEEIEVSANTTGKVDVKWRN